jgi:hypothetical protein
MRIDDSGRSVRHQTISATGNVGADEALFSIARAMSTLPTCEATSFSQIPSRC